MNFLKKRGIIGSIFQLGLGGPNLKANSGVVEARNAADGAYAIISGGTPLNGNDLTTKDYVDEFNGREIREIRFLIDNSPIQTSDNYIPSRARLIEISLEITTPYSEGTTIKIGTSDFSYIFMGTDDNIPQDSSFIYSVPQDIGQLNPSKIYVSIDGSPAAGAGIVVAKYFDDRSWEVDEKVAIDTINVSSSATHTGSAVDMSSYEGGMFDLEITSITAPDAQDSWEIKIQGRMSSSDDWLDLAYWVDDLNAGDNTTTSGDPNRGRFDSGVSAGQHFTIFIEKLMVKDIRIMATAYDQNSDGDMALQATITSYLKKNMYIEI